METNAVLAPAEAAFDTALLARAEAVAGEGNADRVFAILRSLDLGQFGRLLSQPPGEYPRLGAALPPMASIEVQTSWTGSSGERLLAQSVEFVRTVEAGFRELTGRELTDSAILDFGCGWGRLIRLMYRYTEPAKLFGVDPWPESLAACRECRLPGNFALSDNIPRTLPFGNQSFDLIYAFSVFTHLSPKTARIALQSLRKRIAKNGLLVITVRRESYWQEHHHWPEGYTLESVLQRHRADGIAYIPHHRPPTEGELTFGDTSVTEDYVRREWRDWDLVAAKSLALDPQQHVLFLRPKGGLLRFLG